MAIYSIGFIVALSFSIVQMWSAVVVQGKEGHIQIEWVRGLSGFAVALLYLHCAESVVEAMHLMHASNKSISTPLVSSVCIVFVIASLVVSVIFQISWAIIALDALIALIIVAVKLIVWKTGHVHEPHEIVSVAEWWIGVDTLISVLGLGLVLIGAGVYIKESEIGESLILASSAALTVYSVVCVWAAFIWKKRLPKGSGKETLPLIN